MALASKTRTDLLKAPTIIKAISSIFARRGPKVWDITNLATNKKQRAQQKVRLHFTVAARYENFTHSLPPSFAVLSLILGMGRGYKMMAAPACGCKVKLHLFLCFEHHVTRHTCMY
jgi:hypothetical protein